MNDLFPNRINMNSSTLHSNIDQKEISKIYTHHTYPPAARLPRIVKILLENKFYITFRSNCKIFSKFFTLLSFLLNGPLQFVLEKLLYKLYE